MTIDVEPPPLGPDEQLLFLHIAKTAGTLLIRLLDQHFIEDELCPTDWPTRYLLREIKPGGFNEHGLCAGTLNTTMSSKCSPGHRE